MNTKPLILAAAMLSCSMGAVQAGAKDSVMAASQKLAEKDNYSWTTTTKVPEGARWRPGPAHGKTAKNGPTVVEMTFGDNITQMVIHGKKGAITNRDGEWESVEDLENSEGRGRFRANIIHNYMTPSEEARQLVEEAKELAETDGMIAGDLTEEGAKARMMFRRRGGGGGDGGPEIHDAKGSVKFWLKDGELVKYQFKVKGTMAWNGNDLDIDRIVTVEIKDVGVTKVAIPEGAKRKLS